MGKRRNLTYKGKKKEKKSIYCWKANNLVTSVNLKYGAAQNPTALALFWKRSAASEQIGMSGQGQSRIHLDCPADSLRGRGEMAAGANKLEPDRLSLAAERDAHTYTHTHREIGS